jgi:hypothetical protein
MEIPLASSLAAVDEMDPFVAVLTWLLTFVASKYAIPARLRPLIPVIAILIATGLVAGLQASQGEALTFATVIRGLGAGAAAIAGHSGMREAHKLLSSEEAPAEEAEESEEAEAAE